MRLLLILSFTLLSLNVSADDLYNRLRLLVPGDELENVNERQFLYQRITQLYRTMEAEERVHRKGKKKRIKRIRKYLDEHLFKTYDSRASLEDVFLNNRFNDAAAAVLTVLCLEKYDLDYRVFVDHFKIYTIADPDRRKEEFYFGEDKKLTPESKVAYRADYLSAVRSTILPDLPELGEEDSAIAFFGNYYQPEKPLSFSQLAAYSQYRGAQAAYKLGRFPEAIRLAEAALQREDRAAFLVILQAAQTQLTAKVKPQVAGDLNSLYQRWADAPNDEYLPAAILHHFDEQQRLVLTSNAPEMTGDLLATYLSKAPDNQQKWRTEMAQLQQLRLLSHYYKSGELESARQLASQLYQEHPDDAKMKYLLGEIIVDQLRVGDSRGDAFRQRMDVAVIEYPFLQEHPRFIDLYLREQALKVRDLYAEERPDLAGPALEQFRNSLLNLSIGEDRNLWTLTAFAAASYYHFRIEDYRGAIEFIEEGLRYAPDDQYLLHRLTVLQNYL